MAGSSAAAIVTAIRLWLICGLAFVEAFHAYIRLETGISSRLNAVRRPARPGRLTVPGLVRRRFLPPSLACLSTPSDTTPQQPRPGTRRRLLRRRCTRARLSHAGGGGCRDAAVCGAGGAEARGAPIVMFAVLLASIRRVIAALSPMS